MNKRTFVYPYHSKSMSAKAVARGLGAKRIRRENSKFKGNEDTLVINWGNQTLPYEVRKCHVLNNEEAVRVCSNKLRFFKNLEGHARLPPYTTESHTAAHWCEEGATVCARTKLTSSKGRGLILVREGDVMPKAKLYTRHMPIKQEYRVHVFTKGDGNQGRILDAQRKARKHAVPDDKVNWMIRNHKNGFIFARQGLALPDDVTHQALCAFAHTGLDFCAFDVIVCKDDNLAYVIEGNTAPGVEGTTLTKYLEAFDQLQG